jgi:hypothetical protein
LSDQSSRPTGYLGSVVLSAVFVPDGASPPANFTHAYGAIRIPAQFNPATGELTTDKAVVIGSIIQGTWHPDSSQDDAPSAA